MQIIRAFWGNLTEEYKKEILNTKSPFQLNEYVYVWGLENFKFIKTHGFNCELVSDNPFQYGDDFLNNSETFYFHKLDAIKRGCNKFEEVLFLDWDTVQIKEIDSNFFKKLYRKNSKIQMPLYIYPKDYKDRVLSEWVDIKETQKSFIDKQLVDLTKFNYLFSDNWVIPNAGFIFCSDKNIIDSIIQLCIENDVKTCSEEFGMLLYSQKTKPTLDEYIEEFHPIVCNMSSNRFNQLELNNYIRTQVKSDIYFTHFF